MTKRLKGNFRIEYYRGLKDGEAFAAESDIGTIERMLDGNLWRDDEPYHWGYEAALRAALEPKPA